MELGLLLSEDRTAAADDNIVSVGLCLTRMQVACIPLSLTFHETLSQVAHKLSNGTEHGFVYSS